MHEHEPCGPVSYSPALFTRYPYHPCSTACCLADSTSPLIVASTYVATFSVNVTFGCSLTPYPLMVVSVSSNATLWLSTDGATPLSPQLAVALLRNPAVHSHPSTVQLGSVVVSLSGTSVLRSPVTLTAAVGQSGNPSAALLSPLPW